MVFQLFVGELAVRKNPVRVEAQGGFVKNLREVHFLFADTLVWVRPERTDAGCMCERTWASQIPAIIEKNNAPFGQLKFGQLC